MLFYIQSTDPSNYGTVKFSTNSLAGSKDLQYRINQLTTIASFLITTHDDYITFEIEGPSGPGSSNLGEQITFNFEDRSFYDKDLLPSYLTSLFTEFNVSYNSSGTLTLSSQSQFRIIDASHRAKVLLGLYNTQLPTQPTLSYNIESIPYTCYGNNLYLQSRISNIVGFNDSMNKEIYISVCYHIFEIFYPGAPIICRFPGSLIKIKPTDLTNLEFSLVDFQHEPVILKAPLIIALEVIN